MFIGSHFYIEQVLKHCSTHNCVLSLWKKVFSKVNNEHGGKKLFNLFCYFHSFNISHRVFQDRSIELTMEILYCNILIPPINSLSLM